MEKFLNPKSGRREKDYLHPRNRHRYGYDFEHLIQKYPTLKNYVAKNKYGKMSLNFFNPDAVKALNKILLLEYYNLTYWNIPDGYLCPAIPGRAEYIHRVAELIDPNKSTAVICLDIGTGANLVYPIIATHEYSWRFIATDIDQTALQHAKQIIEKNERLQGKISLRHQTEPQYIFANVIMPSDKIDLVICNPPFYESATQANQATRRKVNNLTGKRHMHPVKNFQGKTNELFCEGGEKQFVNRIVSESRMYQGQIQWFSTLISKTSILNSVKSHLAKQFPQDVKIIDISLGNKKSRVLAWKY